MSTKKKAAPVQEQNYQDVKENKLIPLIMLYPHRRNYRQHPPAQIQRIKASLERFGQVRSIVVQANEDTTYTIVAGHGVTEAAQELEWKELRADILPHWWSAEQVTGYLVADNNLSMDATDDETLLAELLQEQSDAGYDLASLGTDDETLRQMLVTIGDGYLGSGEQEGEEDETVYIPDEEQTRVQVGDVWQLGRHKIACLDALDPGTYARLFIDSKPQMVWADPPYGISIVATNVSVGGGEAYDIPFGGVKNRGSVGTISRGMKAKPILPQPKYAPVIGDDGITTALASCRICTDLFPKAIHIWWGANHYANGLPPSSCWIVWDKENDESFFADCELAWTNQKTAVRIFRHMWNGLMKDSEKGQRRVHPTQKPIALAEWCYEKYGKEQDVIYDPFLGSGMSLIAAENMNRTVIGCELSPDYIDVIITRWEKHTGQTATLLERVEEVAHA